MAGMGEAEFWRSTPFFTRLKIEAASERHVLDYRRSMWAAWHAGAFARVKKMPSLNDALRGVDRGKRKTMSADELLQAFEMINVRSGGEDLRKTAH
jgi:hypothetical protein